MKEQNSGDGEAAWGDKGSKPARLLGSASCPQRRCGAAATSSGRTGGGRRLHPRLAPARRGWMRGAHRSPAGPPASTRTGAAAAANTARVARHVSSKGGNAQWHEHQGSCRAPSGTEAQRLHHHPQSQPTLSRSSSVSASSASSAAAQPACGAGPRDATACSVAEMRALLLARSPASSSSDAWLGSRLSRIFQLSFTERLGRPSTPLACTCACCCPIPCCCS